MSGSKTVMLSLNELLAREEWLAEHDDPRHAMERSLVKTARVLYERLEVVERENREKCAELAENAGEIRLLRETLDAEDGERELRTEFKHAQSFGLPQEDIRVRLLAAVDRRVALRGALLEQRAEADRVPG